MQHPLSNYTVQGTARLMARLLNLNDRRLAQQVALESVLASAYFFHVGVSGKRCYQRHDDGLDFWLEPLPEGEPSTSLSVIQALIKEQGALAERMQAEYWKLTDIAPNEVKLIERETQTHTSISVNWAFLRR